MAHSGTKITAPVQILGDLQPVLGTGYNGLGQIITTAAINKWSKYKPFRSTSPNFATNDGSGTWLTDRKVAAEHAAYGFIENPSAQALKSQLPHVVWSNNALGHATYQYYRPNGTPYWCRALDFDGYDHNAVPPMAFECATCYYNNLNGITIRMGDATGGDWRAQTCLTLSDFLGTAAGNYYVGFLLYCTSKPGTVYFLTLGKTVNQLNNSVEYLQFSGGYTGQGWRAEYVCPKLAETGSGGWGGQQVTVAVIVSPTQSSASGGFAGKGTYELTTSGCKFLRYGWTTQTDWESKTGMNIGSLLGSGVSMSLEFETNFDRKTVTCEADPSGANINMMDLKFNTGTISYGGSGRATGSGTTWDWYNSFGTGSNAQFTMVARTGFSAANKTVYFRANYGAGSMMLSTHNNAPDDTRAGQFKIAASQYQFKDGTEFTVGFTFNSTDYLICNYMVPSSGRNVICTVEMSLDANFAPAQTISRTITFSLQSR